MANAALYSWAELYSIAKNQRRLLLIMLCLLLSYVLMTVVFTNAESLRRYARTVVGTQDDVIYLAFLFAVACWIILAIFWNIVLVFLLASMRTPIVWRIVTILVAFAAPFVSLLVLIMVNSSATKILNSAGLNVGLLGVSRNTIRRLHESVPRAPA